MSRSFSLLWRRAALPSLSKHTDCRTIISCASASPSTPVSTDATPNCLSPPYPRQRQPCSSQTGFQNPRSAPKRSAVARGYHSESHPSPDPPADIYTPEQSDILSAALKHVPNHGFSTESVKMGAREAGYLDVSLQLFPRGAELELVLYWLASRRGLLKQKVESGNIFGVGQDFSTSNSPVEVNERVKILIMERLKMNGEILHHWQDVSSVSFYPAILQYNKLSRIVYRHWQLCLSLLA